MQDMPRQEGAYPQKKKIVAGRFGAVKYKPETYCWTQSKIRSLVKRGTTVTFCRRGDARMLGGLGGLDGET